MSQNTSPGAIRVSVIDRSRPSSSAFALELHSVIESCGPQVIPVHEPSAPASTLCDRLLHSMPDIIILILSADFYEEAHALIRSLNSISGSIPIIVYLEDGTPDQVIALLRLGVVDFITSPLKKVDVLPQMLRLADYAQRRTTLTQKLRTKMGLQQLIGESAVFREVINTIPLIALNDVCVHISGETGTGKELCARLIHYLGPRASKPFIPVNCGAIPVDLVENELFGHVQGAYTGATHPHDGLTKEADRGTLFLDEIDCLPLQAQVKILRFIQEKEYRKLGSSKVYRADVRIIVASNTELDQAVKSGKFRQDLYYRLSIIHVPLPPLRERMDDLPLLARHFLDESVGELGKQIEDIAPKAIQKLYGYDWPGNVRELENVIKRAVIFSKGNILQETDICLPQSDSAKQRDSFRAEKAKVIAEFEKRYMEGLLQAFRGNITKAAQAAQKNRRAFWELMRKYKIDVEIYKSPAPNPRT